MLPILGADPDVFWVDQHRPLWRGLVALHMEGVPADLPLLWTWLDRHGHAADAVFLAELSGAAPTSANAAHYAREVADAHRRRELMTLAGHMTQMVQEPDADVREIVAKAARALGSMDREESAPAKLWTRADPADWRARAASEIPWVIPGWCSRGTLTVLGAAGGTGKSVLSLGIAAQVVMGTGDLFPALEPLCRGTVAMFDLEDSEDQTWRILGAYADHYRLGEYLDSSLLERFDLFTGRGGGFVEYDRAGALQVTDRYREFTAYCRTHCPDMVIVNHLRRVAGNAKGNSNEDMGVVMGLLDMVAAECDCAVVVLAHVAKGSDPNSADMRGASSIVDEARMAWKLVKDEAGDLELRRVKSNLSPLGDPVSFAFRAAGAGVCLEQIADNEDECGSLVTPVCDWIAANPKSRVNNRRPYAGDGVKLVEDLHSQYAFATMRTVKAAIGMALQCGRLRVKKDWDKYRHEIFYVVPGDGRQGDLVQYADGDAPF